jgi:hypothetical protein
LTGDPGIFSVALICDRTLRAGRFSPLIEDTTMSVELLPADAHNQRTITQGHPPNWQNPPGGDYALVVLGGGPAGLIAALTAAVGGHRVAMTEKRLDGRDLRQLRLYAKQGPDPLRPRRPRGQAGS